MSEKLYEFGRSSDEAYIVAGLDLQHAIRRLPAHARRWYAVGLPADHEVGPLARWRLRRGQPVRLPMLSTRLRRVWYKLVGFPRDNASH